ncbi:MAG TPA: hypothetical protein VI278_05695 [Nitrososphaeraceae archaeon]
MGQIAVIIPTKKIDDYGYIDTYALLGREEFDITFRETIRKLILRAPKRIWFELAYNLLFTLHLKDK